MERDESPAEVLAFRPPHGLKNLISRIELAASLGVAPQTIAKWQRLGLMPQPKECLSDRLILYDREEVRRAIEQRKAETPPRRSRSPRRVKRVRRRNRLIGFTYDEAAGVAYCSMYVPGTAGRNRKRATVSAATYDEALRLWSEFRSRAAEGLRRPSPEAPTFREFTTDYFPAIAPNLAEKTTRDYRYAIDRHLLPQLGALRLDEITSGVLNRLGARLKGASYAGATVNNYMNLAALLLGYAVELDVIADLPLKKKLKKQKADKPCLELNADERARFLAAFDDEAGFRRFLAETMPKPKPAQAKDGRFGSRRAYGAGMRNDSDAAHAYFLL